VALLLREVSPTGTECAPTQPPTERLNSPSTSNQKIYVAGHRGMVGAAVVRALQSQGHANIVVRTRAELDLTDQAAVTAFFRDEQPATVVFAAARVGGIHANSAFPAPFIRDNLAMAVNAIHAAFESGVGRFLFLGSTCIYPRLAPQPMREDCLLSGPLEPTNEAYALAKIAGLKMCQFYRRQHGVLFHSAMPTNLYGPGDNYHPEHSHVLPALIRRFHEAREAGAPSVTIWGTGTPRREFLHVDDLALALLHLLALDDPPDWVNVGTGTDVTILELARMIAATVGFEGRIETDPSKPDGTPVKRTDISLIRSTGWEPRIPLAEGLRRTVIDYLRECREELVRSV
jgi:GDP-L-fucose synthase